MFDSFLSESGIEDLSAVTKREVDRYKNWRLARVTRRNSKGGTAALNRDLKNLHHVFHFALEEELVSRNPVPLPRERFDPNSGYQPFEPDELIRLTNAARSSPDILYGSDRDWLPFLLPRWTGLRVGDILTLQWKDISWERKEIIRRCLKNGKQVILPVQGDFLIALEREYQTRSPRDEEPVLLDPETGQAFEYEDYRKFLMQLGVRAGVIHVHPHRFRPTFAIDMLLKLGDVYDVARLLADTVAVVERHYLPYVEALRMRARVRMIDGHGLEEFSIKKRADQNEPTGSEEPAGIPAKALP